MDALLREACVETRAELDAARGKADRVELCARLDVGGLSPADDALEYALSRGHEVAAMVRLRAGFAAPPEDLPRLKADLRRLGEGGARALVFGFLDAGGGVDRPALEALCAEAARLRARPGLVFHMAFDELPRAAWPEALDLLVSLGFARILTKGGRGAAADNIPALRELRGLAAGRLVILAGGGVTDANYRRIAAQTGLREFHGRKLGLEAGGPPNK